MIEFKKIGKTSSNRSNSVRNSKLTDRNLRALKRIVGRKHRTTAAKVIAELNPNLNSPVTTETVRRGLNKAGYPARVVIMLSTINIQKRLRWRRDHKGWCADQWKQVSPVFLFPNCRANLCVEADQRSLQPRLLSSHSEARRWISDGLGSHIV